MIIEAVWSTHHQQFANAPPFFFQKGCFEIFRYDTIEPFTTCCCLPIILSPSQNHWLVICFQKRKKYKPIQKYCTYIYWYIIYYIWCFRIQFQNDFFVLTTQPPSINNIQLYTLIYSVLSSEGTSACRLQVVFTYYYVGLGNVYWTFVSEAANILMGFKISCPVEGRCQNFKIRAGRLFFFFWV